MKTISVDVAYALAIAMYRAGYGAGAEDAQTPFYRRRIPIARNLKALERAIHTFARAADLTEADVRISMKLDMAPSQNHSIGDKKL